MEILVGMNRHIFARRGIRISNGIYPFSEATWRMLLE